MKKETDVKNNSCKQHFFRMLSFMLFLCIGLTDVRGENREKADRPFSLALSGGVHLTNIKGGSVRYPLYTENRGGFGEIRLSYRVSKKYGTEFHFSQHFLPTDVEKTGTELLFSNQRARSVSVNANTTQILRLGIGAYRHFALNKRMGFQIAPLAGLSILQSPTITANIDTEPFTQLVYKSGKSTALLLGLDISATYNPTQNFGIRTGIGYAYASHNLIVTDTPSQSFTEKWRYNSFYAKLGVVIAM